MDPLPEAVRKLQAELLEIVSSFEANLAKARDDGLGRFVSRPHKDTILEEDPSVTGSPGAHAPEESSDPRILRRGKEEVFSALGRASATEVTGRTGPSGATEENEQGSSEL